MTDLSAFPITRRWPAQHPDRIQLYSLNTPNGVKAGIMLEETGLPYEAHLIDIMADDQKTPEFLSLNPNGKTPRSSTPMAPMAARSRCSKAVRSCSTSPTRPASLSTPTSATKRSVG